MLALFNPLWGSRVDQDVGPFVGSTTNPLPGKLDADAKRRICPLEKPDLVHLFWRKQSSFMPRMASLPPRLGFFFRPLPRSSFRGVLVMSLEGGFDAVDESFFSRATAASNCAIRASTGTVAGGAAARSTGRLPYAGGTDLRKSRRVAEQKTKMGPADTCPTGSSTDARNFVDLIWR
jgi:hypothetical protein